MNSTNDMYIINIPSISAGNLDGIVTFNKLKNQEYLGNVTIKSKVMKYDQCKVKNVTSYEYVLIYHTRYDENWRHFLNECFCSIRYYYNFESKNIKVIIPKKHAKHVRETIEILNLNSKVIYLDNYNCIFAKKVIYPKTHLDFKFINFFIKECNLFSKLRISNNMTKLYLSREHKNKKRSVTNYNNFFEKCIRPRNYYSLIPEVLHLADQVKIINNSDKIISLIGACCDNIIFTNKNCKFIIICSPATIRWANFYKLTPQQNIGRVYIINTGKVDNRLKLVSNDPYNKHWFIDIESTNKTLNRINL